MNERLTIDEASNIKPYLFITALSLGFKNVVESGSDDENVETVHF